MGKRSPSLVKGKPRFCLGEGSYSSSLGVLSTTLSQACFSTGHLPTRPVVYPRVPGWPQPIPASTSPSPDQASCLRAPPAPDHPMCCVSGSLVIMFCLQGDELGKGVPGAPSETREAERMVRRAAEADSRHCALGRGDTVSWMW